MKVGDRIGSSGSITICIQKTESEKCYMVEGVTRKSPLHSAVALRELHVVWVSKWMTEQCRRTDLMGSPLRDASD